MSIVAWDGTILAADKAGTNSGYSTTVTKVFRVPDGRVGFVGNMNHSQRLLDWFMEGRRPETYPKSADKDDGSDALFIDDTRREVWLYCANEPRGSKIEHPYTAMGSGRDFALAAMHLGHSAVEAVKVANDLNIFCGNGIDYFLKDK
jgi:hypothetical protein